MDESASLPGGTELAEGPDQPDGGGTFEVQATTTRPRITATADGEGVVSHAGSRLLADVADRTTLTAQLDEALAGLRKPRARHDPGRVLVDMAVARRRRDDDLRCRGAGRSGRVVRGGGVGLDVLAAARPSTPRSSVAVVRARAAAREVVWAQRAELTGSRSHRRRRPACAARAGHRLDASIVVCHSEKEQAAPTFKKTFGYHPMLAFCDNTGEFLAGAAARERGQQHRRRPHHRPRRGPDAGPRRAPARHPDPGPGRHRRLHPGVPRPPPRPA